MVCALEEFNTTTEIDVKSPQRSNIASKTFEAFKKLFGFVVCRKESNHCVPMF